MAAACSNATNDSIKEPVNSPVVTESAPPVESPVASESTPPSDGDSEAKSGVITKEQYSNIENGMTYEEIIEIVGSEGEIMAESGEKGSDLYVFIVTYEGTGEMGSSASLTFLNNKLQTKAQFGLQ
ncbi:DUF3862 domain-containing protein [Paenibacillus paeoniae]|uniref:DUF3862 domain-containing protein n=2 Tax=Paenibacillus paeoniae TaxID=2292705 RepID=A0A371PI05_9BACL|nr:DUF3862 domain-containing protein [Paenibacillus paeoniae]